MALDGRRYDLLVEMIHDDARVLGTNASEIGSYTTQRAVVLQQN